MNVVNDLDVFNHFEVFISDEECEYCHKEFQEFVNSSDKQDVCIECRLELASWREKIVNGLKVFLPCANCFDDGGICELCWEWGDYNLYGDVPNQSKELVIKYFKNKLFTKDIEQGLTIKPHNIIINKPLPQIPPSAPLRNIYTEIEPLDFFSNSTHNFDISDTPLEHLTLPIVEEFDIVKLLPSPPLDRPLSPPTYPPPHPPMIRGFYASTESDSELECPLDHESEDSASYESELIDEYTYSYSTSEKANESSSYEYEGSTSDDEDELSSNYIDNSVSYNESHSHEESEQSSSEESQLKITIVKNFTIEDSETESMEESFDDDTFSTSDESDDCILRVVVPQPKKVEVEMKRVSSAPSQLNYAEKEVQEPVQEGYLTRLYYGIFGRPAEQ